MGLRIIVTVKQVPDTHHVHGDAMKPDGTVNRGALPAIFNPEDLHALETALRIKDQVGGTVVAITMGPPKAVEVLRDCLFRGADDVILLSDRRFAGADTLATSFALKCAIEKLGGYDLVVCGRQAIDGDTAQVGPQIAEKLGINQISNIVEVLAVDAQGITARRSTERGHHVVKSRFPVLLTVTNDANTPRPPSARRVAAYKTISVAGAKADESYTDVYLKPAGEKIRASIAQWDVDTIGADPVQCGLSGSPTKVKGIESVVLAAQSSRDVPNTVDDIRGLIGELSREHIIG